MPKRKVSHMQDHATMKAISAAVLLGFFNGEDAAQISGQVAKLEQPRVQYLFGFFPKSEQADVNAAAKGLKDAVKDGDKKAQNSAQQRSQEVKALYGAWRYAGFKPDGHGYHGAVKAAYATLKEKGLRANGAAIPTKEEKAINQQAGIVAAEYVAAEMAKHKAELAGKTLTEEEIEAERERTRNEIERAGAVKMAATIYKRKGDAFSGWLIEALEAQIAAGKVVEEKERKAA